MAPRPGNAAVSPVVHVPGPQADRPSWGRVGVLAAVGFVVGVAWPKLAGIRLGPSVPDSPAAAVSGSSEPPPAAGSAPSAAPVASTSPEVSVPVASAAAPSPKDAIQVVVGRGYIASCKTEDGDLIKGSACGTIPGLDAVIAPRLRRLAACPSADGANGTLRLALTIDFARATLAAELGRGRSSDAAGALLACARTALANASFGSLRHDQPHYVVGYAVTWPATGSGASSGAGTPAPLPAASPIAPASPAGETAAPAVVATSAAHGSIPSDSTAQIEWDVAIVRDAPKTGRVVARLQRGSTVRTGLAQDGWYPVRYGDGFAGEGWIYRGAIGR